LTADSVELVATLITYVVVIALDFSVVCAITKVARGWWWQGVGLVFMIGVSAAVEVWGWRDEVPLPQWMLLAYVVSFVVHAILIGGLSRDRWGRRLFLLLTHFVYYSGYFAVFYAIVFRNCFGLSVWGTWTMGLVTLVVAYFGLIYWVLPQVPEDNVKLHWRQPCLFAGSLLVVIFASGVWPVSIYSAPIRYCMPFVVVSIISWLVCPGLFRMQRMYRHHIDIERNLELLTVEMQMRRTELDLSRRIRHDHRFHRIQLAEYLLRGQTEQALAHLRKMDEEALNGQAKSRFWCRNETLNAIISGGARKAESQAVEFAAEVHAVEELWLPDMDAVAVLANLIDNAINGAASCRTGDAKPAEPSRVAVNIRQREHGIGITVSNSVPSDFALSARGLPCAQPGIGMESIQLVVSRYAGECVYRLENGILTCQVVLMYPPPPDFGSVLPGAKPLVP